MYAYTRELNSKKFLILLNFKTQGSSYNIGIDIDKAKLVFDNYSIQTDGKILLPYQAIIL